MKSRKIPIAISILMSVLAVVGWTLHWHVTVNNVTQTPPKTQASGYMTSIDCASIKNGTKEQEIVNIYNLPNGSDSNTDGSSDLQLSYPLQGDHTKFCNLYFGGDQKLYQVTIDLVNTSAG